jgi:hypothetical protein
MFHWGVIRPKRLLKASLEVPFPPRLDLQRLDLPLEEGLGSIV